MLIKKLLNNKYKILAVGYTIWLTAISLMPLDNIQLPSFSYADKIVHFFLYFFLVTIYLLAFPKYIQKKILLVIFAVLLGIFIEFLQHYLIPTRCGDIYDALANTLGSVIGLLFFLQFVNPKLK